MDSKVELKDIAYFTIRPGCLDAAIYSLTMPISHIEKNGKKNPHQKPYYKAESKKRYIVKGGQIFDRQTKAPFYAPEIKQPYSYSRACSIAKDGFVTIPFSVGYFNDVNPNAKNEEPLIGVMFPLQQEYVLLTGYCSTDADTLVTNDRFNEASSYEKATAILQEHKPLIDYSDVDTFFKAVQTKNQQHFNIPKAVTLFNKTDGNFSYKRDTLYLTCLDENKHLYQYRYLIFDATAAEENPNKFKMRKGTITLETSFSNQNSGQVLKKISDQEDYFISRYFNELSGRFRWWNISSPNYKTSEQAYVSIFEDNFASRATAYFLARKLQKRLETQAIESGLPFPENYQVPICFYSAFDSARHLTNYDKEMQQEDIEIANKIVNDKDSFIHACYAKKI